MSQKYGKNDLPPNTLEVVDVGVHNSNYSSSGRGSSSAQASLNIDPMIKLKSILDMTFTREELRRWLQLYLERIQITTESINALIVGLERGLVEAGNEARRILSGQGVPEQIIEWIISRISSESSLRSDTSF
ncbi:MAG: hypothetical protein KAU48_04275 [Candidatus Thorarchaeota archaeon]|nr:hypothetical protein [Candidatus Thorarchaeota archaeon]